MFSMTLGKRNKGVCRDENSMDIGAGYRPWGLKESDMAERISWMNEWVVVVTLGPELE